MQNKPVSNNGTTVPIGLAVAIISAFAILALGMLGTVLFFMTSNPLAAGQGDSTIYAPSPEGVGEGIFLSGIWESGEPTYNDEFITIEFMENDRFIKITEMYIADADLASVLDSLDEVREFYMSQNGGTVEVFIGPDDDLRMRVTVEGSFSLTANELRLISGDNITNIFPFSWDGRIITINNDLFVQKLGEGPGVGVDN